jgi:hypothetical protein
VLQTRERASTLLYTVFTFGLAVEFIKEFGSASLRFTEEELVEISKGMATNGNKFQI